MRMGIAVDACCDLTDAFLQQHGVTILPAALVLDRLRTVIDDRDPERTQQIYRRYICDRSRNPEIQPISADAIRDRFLDDLVLRYDRLLVLCADARSSGFFANASQASYAVLKDYRQRRKARGIEETFAMRVLDTSTIGPGSALLAQHAVRGFMRPGEKFDTVRREVQNLAGRIRCHLLPADLSYLRFRRSDGQEDSIGALDYRLGRWLGMHTILRFEAGHWQQHQRVRSFRHGIERLLQAAASRLGEQSAGPAITMSFGGDPRLVRTLPAYKDFESRAASRRVELHLAVMSATLAAQVGPGAFAIAWSEA
ncbi:MAG: DegV family protein [Gammaproteobacteria bacterium]